MQNRSKTLVFSIALNGYQWLYKDHLQTHQQYALINHYDYVAVTRPWLSTLGLECAWLKISLLAQALQNGYENVMYIDADAKINPQCPTIESLFEEDKFLYLAKGYSGRFNSGVMIARTHVQLVHDLHTLLNQCEQPVAAEDSVGWGENGHVISYAKKNPFVQTISQKWNNNSDAMLQDYIRHFSMGPLRPLHKAQAPNRLAFFVARKLVAVLKRLPLKSSAESFYTRLKQLTTSCCLHYKEFQLQ